MLSALCRLRNIGSSGKGLRLATALHWQETVVSWGPSNQDVGSSPCASATPSSSLIGSVRCLRTSMVWSKSIEVEAPNMGESISEGTIAALLKKAGDTVEEDEAIAQIETDKVTIDVRAPEAGRIEEYRVAADDTIKVGQVVAVVAAGEGASKVKGEESSSKPAEDPSNSDKQGQQAQSSDQTQQAAQGEQPNQPGQQQQLQQMYDSGKSHAEGRIPGMKFPRRRTDDGTRISLLPAEEQQRWHDKSETPSGQQQSQPQGSPVSLREAQEPQPRKNPWYKGREQGTKLSQSRVLSEREMEQIELGGAA